MGFYSPSSESSASEPISG
ncbi:unnamed protein product, partial [Rotaria magnacalcarata]